jgi:hypothetical protein
MGAPVTLSYGAETSPVDSVEAYVQVLTGELSAYGAHWDSVRERLAHAAGDSLSFRQRKAADETGVFFHGPAQRTLRHEPAAGPPPVSATGSIVSSAGAAFGWETSEAMW